MAATHRNQPIPARTNLPTSHTVLAHQRDNMDRTAEHMAGRMALTDRLARTLRPLVASTVARPTQRHWASLSPPG
jgi:ABC-type transporter Mla subunit MlaD